MCVQGEGGGQNNVGNKARAVYNGWGNRVRRDSLVRIARIASQERVCVGGLKPHQIYIPQKTPDTAIQRFGVSISWCTRECTSETERQRDRERQRETRTTQTQDTSRDSDRDTHTHTQTQTQTNTCVSYLVFVEGQEVVVGKLSNSALTRAFASRGGLAIFLALPVHFLVEHLHFLLRRTSHHIIL
jgi:hypothetical protein